MATIKLRRGLAADLAGASAADYEPLWTTDTHCLYVHQSGTKYLVGGTPSPLTTKGDLWTYTTVDARLPVGSNGQVLTADSTQAAGVKWTTPTSGSVTSVGLSMPSIFTVSGSPVTTSGTLTASLVSQAAKKVLAGPASGGDAAPSFRLLVVGDTPHILNANYSQNGTAANDQRVIYTAYGGGTILWFAAGLRIPCTGTATVTVDLKKNGSSILTSVVVLDSGDTMWEEISGTLSSSTYSAGDNFEVVITAADGGAGIIGSGLYGALVVKENID